MKRKTLGVEPALEPDASLSKALITPQPEALLNFAPLLLAWYFQSGRHHLPWQQTRDPYRVWLSEIMLQQTQVSTVLGYYGRFLEHFPDVVSLANAQQDTVLALWSGLGYYSRARNLHRCAQIVRDCHGGVFPNTQADLQRLPGIGFSTAAAIAAFCFGERVSIFDANVQRVLARLAAYDGDLSRSAYARALQQYAQKLLPTDQCIANSHASGAVMTAYTQGLMDLGATVCSARKPNCDVCPVRALCKAYAQGKPIAYPVKNSKILRTAEHWWLLVLHRRSGTALELWFEKRPQTGIWAGLFCFPVFFNQESLYEAIEQFNGASLHQHAAFKHVLTHKDLYLHLVSINLDQSEVFGVGDRGLWSAQWQGLGLPAPIRKWIDASFVADSTTASE